MRHKETGGVGLVEASRWSCGWMAGDQEKQPAGRTEAESYGPGPTSADRSVQTRTDYKNTEQVELVTGLTSCFYLHLRHIIPLWLLKFFFLFFFY